MNEQQIAIYNNLPEKERELNVFMDLYSKNMEIKYGHQWVDTQSLKERIEVRGKRKYDVNYKAVIDGIRMNEYKLKYKDIQIKSSYLQRIQIYNYHLIMENNL